MTTIGYRWHQQVVKVVDPEYRVNNHSKARVAGRLLEETVELCIASGQTPEQVLGHVLDALANEASKKNLYPTELKPEYDINEVAGELVDVNILQSYCHYINGVDPRVVVEVSESKLQMFKALAREGNLILRDGLIYRKGKYKK